MIKKSTVKMETSSLISRLIEYAFLKSDFNFLNQLFFHFIKVEVVIKA